MPRTRVTKTKEEKVEEILGCAQERLREGGYEALSVAAIARELGLAQNAIYWYFPSKDHLFVAALEQMLREIAARKPTRSKSTVERILWFTDQLEVIYPLRVAMAARARESEVVADFVAGLDALVTRMLSNALGSHLAEEQLPLAVETFRTTVEGAFAKGLGRAERRKVLGFALERLMNGSGAA